MTVSYIASNVSFSAAACRGRQQPTDLGLEAHFLLVKTDGGRVILGRWIGCQKRQREWGLQQTCVSQRCDVGQVTHGDTYTNGR